MEYKVFSNTDLEELEKEVNEFFKDQDKEIIDSNFTVKPPSKTQSSDSRSDMSRYMPPSSTRYFQTVFYK